MKPVRRLIGWVFYLGVLTAAGAVGYFLALQPRCTIRGPQTTWDGGESQISGDGSLLITLQYCARNSMRGPLQVWDTRSGTVVREWLPGDALKGLSFSRDGRLFATTIGDDVVRIVDWQIGRETRVIAPKCSGYFHFSQMGRWLFAGSDNPQANAIIDLDRSKIAMRFDGVFQDFSPDDRWVFVRDDANHVGVWDPKVPTKVATVPCRNNLFLPSPDGSSLAIILTEERAGRKNPEPDAKDRVVELWSLPYGKRISQQDLPFSAECALSFAPNGRILAVWLRNESSPSNLEFIDMKDGRPIWQVQTKDGLGGGFSDDGSLFWFAVGGGQATLHLYDPSDQKVLWTLPRWNTTPFLTASTNPLLRAGVVVSLAESANIVRIYDARTGSHIADLSHPFEFPSLFATADGGHFAINGVTPRSQRAKYFWERWLAAWWPAFFADDVNGVVAVESASGKEIFRVMDAGKYFHVLSADGKVLVTADPSNDRAMRQVIRIWDIPPGRAWIWALSSVAMTIVLCFTLSRLLRALRNRKKTSAPANC